MTEIKEKTKTNKKEMKKNCSILSLSEPFGKYTFERGYLYVQK